MFRTTTITLALALVPGLAQAQTQAQDPIPVGASCLDSEEVIIVEDDANMSVDTQAHKRAKRRTQRDRRRAKQREEELRLEAQAQAQAREQAERRASEAERALVRQHEEAEQAELARRRAERDTVRRTSRLEADAHVAQGDPRAAAMRLKIAAATHDDGLLWVEAAEAFLNALDAGDATVANEAIAAAARAKAARGGDPDPAETSEVVARADAVLTRAPGMAQERRAQHHVARIELAVGGALLGVAAGGFGMLGGGVYLKNATERERARAQGVGVEDLSPLDAQQRRAQGLSIAGGVVGTAGAVLGTTMLALGARDLLRARRGAPSGRRARTGRRFRASLGPGPTHLGASLQFRL